MRRVIILLCILLVSTCAYAEFVPHSGYELSSKGYSVSGFSEKKFIGIDLVLAVKSLPLSLEAGIAIPLLGDIVEESVLNAGIEFIPFVIKDHPFKHWITLDNYYAPSLQITASATCDTITQPVIIGSIHPLRFVVGGGYTSVLSPGLIIDPFNGISDMIAGWEMELFRVGFYLW